MNEFVITFLLCKFSDLSVPICTIGLSVLLKAQLCDAIVLPKFGQSLCGLALQDLHVIHMQSMSETRSLSMLFTELELEFHVLADLSWSTMRISPGAVTSASASWSADPRGSPEEISYD